MKQKKNLWKVFIGMLAKANLPYVKLAITLVVGFIQAQLALDVADLLTDLKVKDLEGALLKADINSLFWVSIFSIVMTVAIYIMNLDTKADIDRNIRKMAVDKMMRLKMKEFKKIDGRQMVTRVTIDAGKISETFVTLAVEELPRLYFMVGVLFKVFSNYDASLGIVVLASIPVTIILGLISGKMIFEKTGNSQARVSELTAQLSEKLNNIQIIKSYNTQQKEAENGSELIEELNKAYTKQKFTERLNYSINTMSSMVPTLAIIVVAASFMLKGSLSKAEYIGYYAIAPTFVTYVVAHLTLWVNIKASQGSTARLAEIMALEEETFAESEEKLDGDIQLRDVSFAYDETKVLNHISLTIEKGKKTAFVGYSGSGKSTVLNLIERFYEIEEGKITFGGKNIADVPLHTLRKKFAYISQNAPGFSGSIRELLTYGLTKEVSDQQLQLILEKTDASAFVEKLGGLDYEVGANASKLSGGQKQKLSIARALLHEEEYMLLDEPTSALDVDGTAKLQQLLDEKMAGKTMVLVAHDMNTVMNADKIIVFNNGEIVAQGTYQQLIKECDLFKQLLSTDAGGEQ